MSSRGSFIQHVEEILRQTDTRSSAYLFSADLAEFRLINYVYGQEKGDRLLKAAEDFIREIPGCVWCERSIADSFLFLVVPMGPHSDEAIAAAYDEWARTFLDTYQDEYPSCRLRIWCGISQVQGNDIISAIDHADMARKEAKRSNAGSAVMMKKSMLEEMMCKRRRESEVMSALEEGRFIFYLQPQVDLATGTIIGAEALARGVGRQGELILPDQFVSVLESDRSIIELDRLILRKVCQDMRQRLDRGEVVVRTSINLSRQHICESQAAENLDAIVREYQIPPELIMFELTENILITDLTAAKDLGDTLCGMGYGTAVDDFGSGYAGIDIWQRLEFDELKLDKTFLEDDPKVKQRDRIIAQGLIWIANRLDTTVVCEGVERADQCRELMDMSCHRAQGFYFSKPVPPDEFYQNYAALCGRYPTAFMDV